MKTLSKHERLEIKIMEILADYKFNSNNTETCEMVANRIINLMINSKIKKTKPIYLNFTLPCEHKGVDTFCVKCFDKYADKIKEIIGRELFIR